MQLVIISDHRYRPIFIILILLALSFIVPSQSETCQGGRPQPNLKINNISCILEEGVYLNEAPISVHYIINCTGKDMGRNPRIIFHFNDTLRLHSKPIVYFPDKNNYITNNYTIIDLDEYKNDLVIALRDCECFNEMHTTDVFLGVSVPWQSSSRSFDLMHSSFLELDAQIDDGTRIPCILKILSKPTITSFKEINGKAKVHPGDNLTFVCYFADNDSNVVNLLLLENGKTIQNHEYSITPGCVEAYNFSYKCNNTEGNYFIQAVVTDRDGLNSTSDAWSLSASNLSASNLSASNLSASNLSASNLSASNYVIDSFPSNIIKSFSLILLFLLMVSINIINIKYLYYSNYLFYSLSILDIILLFSLFLKFSIFFFKVYTYLSCLIILNVYFFFVDKNESKASVHTIEYGTLYTFMTNLIMFLFFLLITFTNTNQYISKENVFLVYNTIIITFLGYIFFYLKQIKADFDTFRLNIQRLCHLSGSMLICSIIGLIIEISWLAEPSSELLKFMTFFAQDYSILLLCPLLLILIKFKLDGS